jgi:hypothetical protein
LSKEKEFWEPDEKLQRKELKGTTTTTIEMSLFESADVFSVALNWIRLCNGNASDSRNVPVDFHVADTNLSEFWVKNKDIQRNVVEERTRGFLEDLGIIAESANVFSSDLNSLMDELNSIKRKSTNSLMVAVDFQIADTNLQYQFDLQQFEE